MVQRLRTSSAAAVNIKHPEMDNNHHHMHAEVTEVDSNDLNQVCHALLLVGKC